MSATLKFNGWPLVPLLCLLVALQIISPSRVWMSLLIGLGATVAFSWVWARQMQKHVHLTREKRYTWTRVGDRLEERFSLRDDSPLPALWAEILDGSTLPGYRPGRVTGVEGEGVNRWITTGICTQRGVFNLGPTTLRLGDPFGLFTVTRHYPATVPYLVLPAVLSLPGVQVAPGGQLSEGRPRPYAPQPTLLAASVRPYLPGDSLHLVHWPTVARREAWYVRTFDGAPAGDWWIVLDLAEEVHHGQGLASTLEQGVTLAASLAEKGLQAGHGVGLIAHSREPLWLPPATGEVQRWSILRRLATIEAGAYPLATLLERAAEALVHPASLVVITPARDPAWLEPLLSLRQRGLVPTLMLLAGETGRSEMAALHTLLAQHNLTAYVMEPEALIPEFDPKQAEGRWEWRTTALGRTIAVHHPEGEWEPLQ